MAVQRWPEGMGVWSSAAQRQPEGTGCWGSMAGNASGGSGVCLGNKVPLLSGIQRVGLPLQTLPTPQPLPRWALGGNSTRVSTPQSFATSSWSLPLQALEGDPMGVKVCTPVVAALSLPGLSKQVCSNQLLLLPHLTLVWKRCLRVTHM